MKIRKLRIQNYRVFDDIEFDFTDREGRTLDTVVLAGVNGCGKTTVLEVLKNAFSRRGSRFHEMPTEIIFDFDFEPNEVEKLIKSIDDDYGKPQNAKTFETLNQIRVNKVSSRLPIVFTENYSGNEDHVFDLVRLISKTLYFPINESNNIVDSDEVIRLYSHQQSMKNSIVDAFLNEVIKNEDVSPKETKKRHLQKTTKIIETLDLNTRLVDFENKELVFESANGQRIYFEQLSHGEQNLYFRAIYLSQLNLENAILLIDEPEAAFHPTWQQKIAKLYQQVGTNNQVFMATHSPHIMASVPPESLFVLHVEEGEAGKKKIRAVNMGKAGMHTLGVDPNRILQEIMQVETLVDAVTQVKMDRLAALLTLEDFEKAEAENLATELTNQLGRQAPFIMRVEHQLLMLRRKKEKQLVEA